MEQTPSLAPVRTAMPLVNTDDLIGKTICKKCGKLAVEGLCDQTVQGDMTAWEYFAPGTEPYGHCDCHIRITLCSESGMRCSRYCPESCKYDSIFLKSAVPGTEDEGFAAEWLTNDTCSTHTSLWDKLMKSLQKKDKDKDKNKNNNSNGNGNGNGGNDEDADDGGEHDGNGNSDHSDGNNDSGNGGVSESGLSGWSSWLW